MNIYCLLMSRAVRQFFHALVELIVVAAALEGERLPIQVYTPADGLAQSTVHRITRDRRGFLWFGTSEGLSRYDGHDFVTYREGRQARQPRIRAISEDSDGTLWVGGDDGLCRVNPLRNAARVYECWNPTDRRVSVQVLFTEPSGEMLAGTNAGLYRVTRSAKPQFTQIELDDGENAPSVWAIVPDSKGRIWAGGTSGLHLLANDKGAVHLTVRDGLPRNEVLSLAYGPEGKLWVGTERGLCRINTAKDRPVVDGVFTEKDGLPGLTVKVIHRWQPDTIWIGTTAGIAKGILEGGEIARFRSYTEEHGLSDVDFDTMEEDLAGNLWMGSQRGGAMKLTRGGFTSYGLADGLGARYVMGMMETRDGEVCAMTRAPGRLHVNCMEGERVRSTAIPVDGSYYSSHWAGWNQVAAETAAGEWWIGSERGLLVFPPGWRDGGRPPRAVYGSKNGLLTNDIYQVFEDSKGGIWVATRYVAAGVARWDPKSKRFRQFSQEDGLPLMQNLPGVERARPNGFGEDAHGQIWIGWWKAGVLRYANGRFELFEVKDGVPRGGIRRIHTDRKGRVWIGSGAGGVGRIDNPTAKRPTFQTYSPADGLSTAEIQSITEDRQGRIYLGHGLGVDRIDPDAAGPLQVRRFTTEDGLAGGEQQTALRDRHGALWFGSVQGLSRLMPSTDRPTPAPRVYLTSVTVNGHVQPLGGAASVEARLPPLHAAGDQLQIEYAAPRFAPGDVMQYQYRLGDSEPWSAPTTQRSVLLAELPAGKQRFEVRAVNGDGVVSETNAILLFEAIPPVWRRWWFVLGCVAAMAGLGWRLHVYDVRRRLELQGVRMQIARDLHDHVGSGLSQIAILSEVAQRSEEKQQLKQIGDIAREMVDSISDIVWAINPARDNLPDLAQRMRRFAADLLTPRGIDVVFEAAGMSGEEGIDPETRRQVFLIYRECLRNVVRHSRCQSVKIRIVSENGALLVEVADDGVGFDRAVAQGGTGLASVEERARSLGGRIVWLNGTGTTVTLRVPLPV